MTIEIVSYRPQQEDAEHDHVLLVGYRSPHIASEPIMLSVERTLQRIALGERVFMRSGDAEADLVPGKCPHCGHEPYLRTTADQDDIELLAALPEG